MKLIKNKAFRFILFMIGFAGIISSVFCMVDAITAYGFFGRGHDLGKPFAESEFMNSNIESTILEMESHASYKRDLNSVNFDDIELKVYDFKTPDKELKLGAKEIVGTEDIYNAVYTNVISTDNCSYENISYSDNISSYAEIIPGNENGTFYRMTIKEYTDYIRENGEKLDNSLMIKYQAKWSESQYDESSADEIEIIYRKINRLFEEGVIFTDLDSDSDIIYYMYDSNSGNILIYSPNGKYIYRSGDYVLNGRQNLEKIDSSYIYIDYKDKMTKEDFINSFMYCTGAEAIYSSLSESDKSSIMSYSPNNNFYHDGTNVAYSFDNKEIDSLFLSDNFGIGSIYNRDSDGYNISYKDFSEKLEQSYDIYISYDKDSKKLTEWYKTPTGDKKEFKFINSSLQKSVYDYDFSFVIATRFYNVDSPYGLQYSAYNFCRMIPSPVNLVVIGLVIFLLVVILLTVGEPAKMRVIDKIPYIIFTAVMILIVGFSGFCMIEVLKNSIDAIGIIMTEPKALMLGIIMLAFVIYIICAAIYLSVVRRIKCKKFLKGFIIVWLYCFLKKNLKGNVKLILFLLGFCMLTFINSVLMVSVSSNPEIILPILFMFIIDIVAILFIVKYMADMQRILSVSKRIEAGELDAKVDTNKLLFNNKELGVSMNNLGEGLSRAVEASVRDERTKAELITNVSHDIKTPLTSIINYVDLLKREDIKNPKAKEYIEVLDNKSERLKQLILDLIEASKTSTGNIELERMNLNLVELLGQVIGEYEDKFAEKRLELVKNISAENVNIYADGRRVFRIIDNIFGNVYKYAQEGTRVYLNLGPGSDQKRVVLSLKNVSKEMLNISADELAERFVRGDKSRHTEGSGLGLSIAKNLTEMHDGTFKINIDGDLFSVIITLPVVEEVNDN